MTQILTPEQAETELKKYEKPYTQENKRITYKILQNTLQFKDQNLEAAARYQYFQHLVHLTEYDEAIIQYGWLLNYLLKEREKGQVENEYNIVWAFKWIIDDIPSFADIPLSKQNDLWQQFVDTYHQYNSGEKVLYYFAIEVQLKLGQLEKSKEALKLYQTPKLKSGYYSDCGACQKDRLIEIYNYHGTFEEAVKLNSKVGEKGFKCAEVPQRTYPKMCFANLMVEDYASAEFFFIKSLEKLQLKISHIDLYHFVLYYLAIKKDHSPAIKIINEQLGYTLETKNDFINFHFLHACCYTLKALKMAGHDTLSLTIKGLDSIRKDHDQYMVDELIEYTENRYQYHVERIDKRNENTFWQNYLRELEIKLAKLKYIEPITLNETEHEN